MPATSTISPAAEFATLAREGGWNVDIHQAHGSEYVVSVERTFSAGDHDAYSLAECDAYRLIGLVPMNYAGSVWGTTGDGVGGHAGLTGGYMRLSQSGVGARFAKSAAKALGQTVRMR